MKKLPIELSDFKKLINEVKNKRNYFPNFRIKIKQNEPSNFAVSKRSDLRST